MNSLRVAGIAFILLVCSCQTTKPPVNQPLHGALPETFQLTYWEAMTGASQTWEYERGYLVCRFYEERGQGEKSRKVVTKTEYFVPSESQWRAFWKELERMRTWSWRKNYDPSDIGEEIFDGGGWKLVIVYQGRRIETGGENAGPKPDAPKTTVTGWEKWNDQIEKAVSILTNEKL